MISSRKVPETPAALFSEDANYGLWPESVCCAHPRGC